VSIYGKYKNTNLATKQTR